MKALLAYAPGDLRIMEVKTPRPGPRELLVRVTHCGVCATDVSIANGTLNLGKGLEPIYPVRLGHEWSGVVEEAGSETWRVRPGDRVISDTGYSCGECAMCMSGSYQNCERGRAIGTVGACWPGAFAEFMLIPERIAYQIPGNVRQDEAALVEPASIGLYGLTRAGVGPGKTLLIIGTGAIGMGGMACAKGMGVGRTILAGRKDAKLEIGRLMGADALVNTRRESLGDAVLRETGGKGADAVLDTTGDPSILHEALEMVRISGALVIPGFYEATVPNFPIDRLVIKNATMIGAAGTPNMGRMILDMMANGHVSLAPMITHRFPFAEAAAAFRAVEELNDSRVKILVEF